MELIVHRNLNILNKVDAYTMNKEKCFFEFFSEIINIPFESFLLSGKTVRTMALKVDLAVNTRTR